MLKQQISLLCLIGAVFAAPRVAAQDDHIYKLSPAIAALLPGTYTLRDPTSWGERELTVAQVEGRLRLKGGSFEGLLMVAGGKATSETKDASGKNTATSDIYRFTVASKPGVLMQFWITKGAVSDLMYSEDFSKPQIMTSGKRKLTQ